MTEPSQSNSKSARDSQQSLPDKIDPALVHRVLLTEPDQFSSLSVSPQPRIEVTPSYGDFEKSLDVRGRRRQGRGRRRKCSDAKDEHDGEGRREEESVANNDDVEESSAVVVDASTFMANCIKGAYRDELVDRVMSVKDDDTNEPAVLVDLLLTLHRQVRELIPSRADLHGWLDDEKVQHQTKSVADVLECAIEAGNALQRLESEARSVTTRTWMQTATDELYERREAKAGAGENSNSESSFVSFTVTSILYLMFKSELCQLDKQDFYLSSVWAPQIHARGIELERKAFEKRHPGGCFVDGADDSSDAVAARLPSTNEWIEQLVKLEQRQDTSLRLLLQSSSERKRLVFDGWIRTIIFRRQQQEDADDVPEPLTLPEIWELDIDRIQSIRQITRVATAGSALALYACQTAGRSSIILEESNIVDDDDDTGFSSQLRMRRHALVQALVEQSKPLEVYERDVTDAVVALALEWNPSLQQSHIIDVLGIHTTKVLRHPQDDPVTKLLESRMVDGFCELMRKWCKGDSAGKGAGSITSGSQGPVPTSMRTGRASTTTSATKHCLGQTSSKHQQDGISAFCQRGLAFYASDLATAAGMAYKIAQLGWNVYGDVVIDPLILKACHRRSL